jgi:hypothetical protein
VTLKYGQLVCDSGNIGDDIQSLAAAAQLPRTDFTINRDSIRDWRSDAPVALVMNGWFSAEAATWPPASSIRPIFVGFHVTDRFKPTLQQHVDYLKKFEPIGVRDEATGQFLQSLGIESELTFCLTLTFPERESAPQNGKVYLVDAPTIAVPRSLRRSAVKMSHGVAPVASAARLAYAGELLKMYRDTARLVITTRLHVALPCIAMGIPVVFFADPRDGRMKVVEDVGGKIYDARLHSKFALYGALGSTLERVDWSPEPLHITDVKSKLKAAVARRLAVFQEDFGATS